MSKDMMVMPKDHVKAFMKALLTSDRIKEPFETILSDDAEAFHRKANFLQLMGLKPGMAFHDAALMVHRAGALNRALSREDLGLKLRMIIHEDDDSDDEMYEIGGDGPEPFTRTTNEPPDVAAEADDDEERPEEAPGEQEGDASLIS